MFRLICIFLLTALLLPTWQSAQAQQQQPLVSLENQIEAARNLMRTQRKLIIASELFLTSEESKAFWPVFNKYEADMRAIGDMRVRLMIEYANNYASMTPELAERMLEESLDIQSQQAKQQRKYSKKFKKVLPVIKVVQLFQIDSKLNAKVDYELAATIPLIQETGVK